MMLRSLAVMLAATLCVAPSFAQTKAKASKPAFVVQTQPLSKILDDVKAVTKLVAGEEAAQQIDDGIMNGVGEKGFAGIDLLRPFCGYLNLSKAIESPEDVAGVLVVPVTTEKEFIDFLKRIKVDVEPVKGVKGLYGLYPPDSAEQIKVRMRFSEGHAHIGINLPNEALAADKLVNPASLIDPGERGLFAMTSYLSEIPKEYLDQQKDQFKQMNDSIEGLPLPGKAKEAFAAYMKTMTNLNEQVYRDGEKATVRLLLDRTTNEVIYETSVFPKKGTPLMKDIAARKPTTNRFAALLNKDSTAGFLLQAPLFSKELNKSAAAGIEFLADTIRNNDPPPAEYAKLFDAAMEGLARTLKSGDLDVAAAISNPTKDGHFGITAAVTFDDPSSIEKELRGLHKNAPEGVQALVKLDVAKVGTVNIHQAMVGAFLPPEPKKVFGENASLCLAFAPKAVYVAFGPKALDEIKAAVTAKPGTARALNVALNPAKLRKFVKAVNEEAGEHLGEAIGGENELLPVLFMDIAGGKDLTLRFGVNLKTISSIMNTLTYSSISEK